MTREGALNILRDKDITESSELPIAVKALIALVLEQHPEPLIKMNVTSSVELDFKESDFDFELDE